MPIPYKFNWNLERLYVKVAIPYGEVNNNAAGNCIIMLVFSNLVRMKKWIASSIYLLGLLVLATSCGSNQQGTAQTDGADSAEIAESQPVELYYGLDPTGYERHEAVIKRNEFLSDILGKYNVDFGLIDQLARDKSIFDVRYIRAGNPYTVLTSGADSSLVADYFIYEKNKIDYVVYDFQSDSLKIWEGKKPVTTQRREIAGVINSSLYESMLDAGGSPLLAGKLSDIYAWTIDFYSIQKGDNYKLLFSEAFVDGESVGIDTIFGCYFNFRGRDFYGIRYEQDGKISYFNEEGQSLQKEFLQAPLRYSRISSRYNPNRYHPVLKRRKPHLGTDYAAPHGTPIVSVGDGVVTHATRNRGNGNYVKIKHNSTFTTQYLHMSRFAKGMKAGKMVKQGEVIGYVGSTGLATGPHLCFRFWKNGKQVDPFLQDLPPAFPVAEENMGEFQQLSKTVMGKLDQLEFDAPRTEEFAEDNKENGESNASLMPKLR